MSLGKEKTYHPDHGHSSLSRNRRSPSVPPVLVPDIPLSCVTGLVPDTCPAPRKFVPTTTVLELAEAQPKQRLKFLCHNMGEEGGSMAQWCLMLFR
jgi:hypothetical protein